MARYDEEDQRSRRRSSGLPTWLVVTLSVLLLFGLVCAGLLALLIHAGNGMIQDSNTTQTNQSLEWLASSVSDYRQQQDGYPATLTDLKALNSANYYGQDFLDYRDQKNSNTGLIYLPPQSNSEANDILAHTRRDGPLPILAVRLSGQLLECATLHDLELALFTQETRPLPDESSFAPPPKPQPQNGSPNPWPGLNAPLLPNGTTPPPQPVAPQGVNPNNVYPPGTLPPPGAGADTGE